MFVLVMSNNEACIFAECKHNRVKPETLLVKMFPVTELFLDDLIQTFTNLCKPHAATNMIE